MRTAAFCIVGLIALPAAAQERMDTTNSYIDAMLTNALEECVDEVRGDDPTAPTPTLLLEPGALTWVDLDGEEEKNDAVVDFNHILCSLNYSLWHGSGGSIIHLVINGERSASLSGGYWQIITFFERPLFLLGRHGSACDGYGAQPCVQAISVFEDGFSTVRFPEYDETDARP